MKSESEIEETRIAICGGPRTGKTTLARSLSKELEIPLLRGTDDLIHLRDWKAQTLEVASWLDSPGSWIIEGVMIPHAIDYRLKTRLSIPLSKLTILSFPKEPLTEGQTNQTRAIQTVLKRILPQMQSLSVPIVYL